MPFPVHSLKCTDTLVSMRMVWLGVMDIVPTEFLTSLLRFLEDLLLVINISAPLACKLHRATCSPAYKEKKNQTMDCIRDFSLLLKCLSKIFCIKLKTVTFCSCSIQWHKRKNQFKLYSRQ